MDVAGPGLALLAAVAWGATDFVGGVSSRAAGLLVTLLLQQAFGTLVALGLLWVVGEGVPPLEGLAWTAVAGTAGLMGVACLWLALSRGTMGLVAPLVALVGAALPALLGILRGDPVGPMLAAGMLVAFAAIVVIALPDRRVGGPVLPTYHGSRAREWLLIVASGLGTAGFFLCIDRAHDAGVSTVWGLAAMRIVSLIIVGTVALAVLARGSARTVDGPASLDPGVAPWRTASASLRRIPRVAYPLGLTTALLDAIGTPAYIAANAVGTLSVTVVLASLYPVSTALLARVLLHERLSPLRLAGVGLAVLGVILIGLGALNA